MGLWSMHGVMVTSVSSSRLCPRRSKRFVEVICKVSAWYPVIFSHFFLHLDLGVHLPRFLPLDLRSHEDEGGGPILSVASASLSKAGHVMQRMQTSGFHALACMDG